MGEWDGVGTKRKVYCFGVVFFKELGPRLTLVIDIEEETVNISEQSAH